MSDPFEFRSSHIGRAVARAFWMFEDVVEQRIREAGFTDFRKADVQVIRSLPIGGATVVELAARSSVSKQRMSKLVSGLEERDYVTCTPDPDDRRAKRVSLRPRGKALLEAAGKEILRVEQEWADVVGKKKLDDVKKTLFTLSDTLGPKDYI